MRAQSNELFQAALIEQIKCGHGVQFDFAQAEEIQQAHEGITHFSQLVSLVQTYTNA